MVDIRVDFVVGDILFIDGILELLGFCPVAWSKAFNNLVSSSNCLMSSSIDRVEAVVVVISLNPVARLGIFNIEDFCPVASNNDSKSFSSFSFEGTLVIGVEVVVVVVAGC